MVMKTTLTRGAYTGALALVLAMFAVACDDADTAAPGDMSDGMVGGLDSGALDGGGADSGAGGDGGGAADEGMQGGDGAMDLGGDLDVGGPLDGGDEPDASADGAVDAMPDAGPVAPTVVVISPRPGATGVALNRTVAITFSEVMDPATIDGLSFRLTLDDVAVPAQVTTVGAHALLEPTEALLANTQYAATITTDAESLAGLPLAVDRAWTFTTGDAVADGPAPVNLGTAGDFVILAKSGIDTVPNSVLTGDIGVSPIDATAMTGFSLSLDASGEFSTSTQLVGQAFAADYAVPTPATLTTAVSDMETAFTDAAGRPLPDFTELGNGDISALTLVPGLYKWGTGVLISTDVTLDGGPNDVWIFQIAGGITQAAGARVLLAGGAVPQNIFWQAFGAVALDSTAHFEGVILSQTEIVLGTGATANGRLLSQTAVTLDANQVTEPSE